MTSVVVTQVMGSGPARRTRTLDERLMVRFPGAYRVIAAFVWRWLRPRSQVRRALLRRQQISG
jgi:hypothetical protein